MPPDLWSRELRGRLPARPGRHRLISGFCSSARRFVSRFLQRRPRDRHLAVPLGPCDQVPGGLSPPSQCPCRAYKRGHPQFPGGGLLPSASDESARDELSHLPPPSHDDHPPYEEQQRNVLAGLEDATQAYRSDVESARSYLAGLTAKAGGEEKARQKALAKADKALAAAQAATAS